MATLAEFIARHEITMDVDTLVDVPEYLAWAAQVWKCTLRRGDATMVVPFGGGSAVGTVDAETVLDCLASDAAGYDAARSFGEWCDDYGMVSEGHGVAEAERIYQATGKQRDALAALIGDDAAFEELLYDTDRL